MHLNIKLLILKAKEISKAFRVEADKKVQIRKLTGRRVYIQIISTEPFTITHETGTQDSFVLKGKNAGKYGLFFYFEGGHITMELGVAYTFWVRADAGAVTAAVTRY